LVVGCFRTPSTPTAGEQSAVVTEAPAKSADSVKVGPRDFGFRLNFKTFAASPINAGDRRVQDVVQLGQSADLTFGGLKDADSDGRLDTVVWRLTTAEGPKDIDLKLPDDKIADLNKPEVLAKLSGPPPEISEADLAALNAKLAEIRANLDPLVKSLLPPILLCRNSASRRS